MTTARVELSDEVVCAAIATVSEDAVVCWSASAVVEASVASVVVAASDVVVGSVDVVVAVVDVARTSAHDELA